MLLAGAGLGRNREGLALVGHRLSQSLSLRWSLGWNDREILACWVTPLARIFGGKRMETV
jgi:hypothetical protein